MSSNNQVAIVTGASRGIGREIALQLAQDGFAVLVNYAGKQAKAQEVVDEIQKKGGKAIPFQGDVGNLKDMENLFNKAKDEFGRVNVVVNSAGIMSISKIADCDLDVFDDTIRTNLRGTFILFSLAARHVESGGRIIEISTSAGGRSFPGYGAYIASKHGSEGLVHVLANELRGRNITVNAVAPGPVATELFFHGKSEELVEQLRKLPPIERLGETQDISKVVSFLASPTGGWVNSQVIRVNGGFTWN